MKKTIPASELIINPDGTCFHLHLHPSQLTDNIILVGDPGRVDMVAEFFDTRDFEVSSREFHTIGGTYKGKPVMCLSHGIGPDNIDIVINELDALANIDFDTREVHLPFDRLRWSAQLLCRTQRSIRSRFRREILQSRRLESNMGTPIRRRCR